MPHQAQAIDREAVPQMPNRLGLEGIEFIEYATTRPQALGHVLEAMGFRAVARHRSREVVLYRQGSMNLVVNAHASDARVSATVDGHPVISAVAFRVKDAQTAHQSCIGLGAWDVASHAQAMELHIPAIQGPGGSRFYFVDRWREFSIYDVDFVPIPGAEQRPTALCDMGYFGIVQYIGASRTREWVAYLETLFNFITISDDKRFGILPSGTLMSSPCGSFLWQLVEPDPRLEDDAGPECLQRIGLGLPDVPTAVAQLQARGIEFVDSATLHPEDRGALTRSVLGSVSFELVHQPRQPLYV